VNKSLKFLIEEFLYNGHIQALGAVGIVLIASLTLISRLPSILYVIAFYLVFETIYLFDRYQGIKVDAETNSIRTRHLASYSQNVPLIICIAIIMLYLLLVNTFNTSAIYFASVVLFFGLLYPVYFKKLTKRIPLFKNVYVSSVFGILIILPSILAQEISISSITIYLFVYVIAESMVSQIFLDTKDISSDKKEHLKTLPVLAGLNKSILIANVLAVTSAAFALVFSRMLPTSIMLPLIFLNLGINFCTAHFVRQKRVEGYLLAAGKFSLWFFVALTSSII